VKITIDDQINQERNATDEQMEFAWQIYKAFKKLLTPHLRTICKLAKISFKDYPLFQAIQFQIVMPTFDSIVQWNLKDNTLLLGTMEGNDFHLQTVFRINEIWKGKSNTKGLSLSQKKAQELLFALKIKAGWHISELQIGLNETKNELKDLLDSPILLDPPIAQ